MNIVIRKLFSCYCIIKSDFLLISKSQSIFEYILELEDKTTDYNIKTDLVIFLLEQLDIVHEDIKFLFHSICRYCRIEVIKWCIENWRVKQFYNFIIQRTGIISNKKRTTFSG